MRVVVYVGENEVMVTTPELEQIFIEDYFERGSRDIDDYERLPEDLDALRPAVWVKMSINTSIVV